jgi:predicted ATP-binding protein involved in virulence
MSKVFISYSSKDKKWVVEWLLPRLEAAGIQVYIDFRDFKIGTPYDENERQAVEICDKVLLVITPDWLRERWYVFQSVVWEFVVKQKDKLKFLPLKLKESELPKSLAKITYADFTIKDNRDTVMELLLNQLGTTRPVAPEETTITSPAISLLPISLKRFKLSNIKCFKELELSFIQDNNPRPWSLLVGDNGVGKTTILHAIILCSLGPELASKIVAKPQHMLRVGAEQGYMEATFEASFQSKKGKAAEDVTIRLEIEKGSRTFNINKKSMNPQVQRFLDARKRTDIEDWFAAGYGAVRNLLFTDEPSKIAHQDPVIERVESLFDPTKLLIDPASMYRFITGDTSPFREMGAPPKLNPQTVNHIQEILDRLLPMVSLQNPNGSGNLETPFGKVPISELSEGYKSMLSWLAHLIMHLLASVQWTGNIREIRGIVLIDEVDLHLHPSWQQQVIPMLKESFPNLQFIGSTHSPMTAGGADDGDLILLDYREGNIKARQDLPSIKGWRADQILTGPLFNLESSRDLFTQKKLEEYTRLLESPKLSAKQKQQLRQLEESLGQTLPGSGETPLQREAFRMIEESMHQFLEKQTADKKKQLLDQIKQQLKQ